MLHPQQTPAQIHRTAEPGLRLGMFALTVEVAAEVEVTGAQRRVLVSEPLLPQAQGAAQHRLGLGVLALAAHDMSEIEQAEDRLVIRLTQVLLTVRQRL